jgi:hypothetical protein
MDEYSQRSLLSLAFANLFNALIADSAAAAEQQQQRPRSQTPPPHPSAADQHAPDSSSPKAGRARASRSQPCARKSMVHTTQQQQLKPLNPCTPFDSDTLPDIDVKSYVHRLMKYCNSSNGCFLLAALFMERLMQKRDLCITMRNFHRIFITT